ncbi:T9SS type A sorting domain-containing protein [Cryomorphaceae bacterium 1068]|nr:T9SS type A sorting domain-containing protein [Cryomorphaceae bacterium 1068]
MRSLLRLEQWILICSMIVLSAMTSAQNLVPNGGFEEGIICPTQTGNVTLECSFWYASITAPIQELPTPDWYHTCSEIDLLSPPELVFGNEAPFAGEGLIGFVTYSANFLNAREIIGVELIEPLVIDNSYLVEFKVSGMENPEVLIETNNVGFNFSTHEFYALSEFPINSSHYTLESIIPIEGWTTVSEVFVADSAYNYLHIGNFYNDTNTIADLSELPDGSAYYAIDEVSVTPLLSVENKKIAHDNFKLYPNPARSVLNIKNLEYSTNISEIAILTINGLLVKQFNFSKIKTQYQIDISSLNQGLYILKIITPKNSYNERFVKV